MRVASILGTATAVALMLYLAAIFEATPPSYLVTLPPESRGRLVAAGEASRAEASYLWNERGLDTLFQGFLVFTAVASTLALMRREGEHRG